MHAVICAMRTRLVVDEMLQVEILMYAKLMMNTRTLRQL